MDNPVKTMTPRDFLGKEAYGELAGKALVEAMALMPKPKGHEPAVVMDCDGGRWVWHKKQTDKQARKEAVERIVDLLTQVRIGPALRYVSIEEIHEAMNRYVGEVEE